MPLIFSILMLFIILASYYMPDKRSDFIKECKAWECVDVECLVVPCNATQCLPPMDIFPSSYSITATRSHRVFTPKVSASTAENHYEIVLD